MTPLLSWAAVLVGGALVTSAAVWVTSAIIVGRDPWRTRRCPTLDEIQAWPPPMRDAWRRHPMHTDRCRCDQYGMMFGPYEEYDPSGYRTVHTRERCGMEVC